MRRETASLLFAVGFLSLLGQVVLLRELSATLYGSELVLILALGAWMSGTALGALAGRALTPGAQRVLLAAGGALVLFGIVWCRGARPALGGVPGAYLPFVTQLVAIAVALPASAVFGAVFQSAARAALGAGGTLASAYAIESAGALAGGLLATLALRAGLSNLTTGIACALAALAFAIRPGRRFLAAFAFAIFAVSLFALEGLIDRWMTSWTHPHLVMTRDTPYGRATITGSSGQIAVFQNDVLAFETEGTSAEEFVDPAALQVSSLERVLVLEAGSSGLVAEALEHGPAAVHDVELDRRFQRLVMMAVPDSLRRALENPKVSTVFEDPRRFVREAGRRGDTFDLVLVGAPQPESGQTNRFYTREFFGECAAVLGGKGVLALRLPSAENYWIPPLVRRTASIERAMRTSFSSVLVLPGTTSILLASNSPLASDPEILVARQEGRRLRPRLTTPAYIRYLYTNDRVVSMASQLDAIDVPANSDGRPVCYPYTLMIWLSMFHPGLATADPVSSLSSGRAAAITALAGVVLWLAVRRSRGRRAAIIAAAGAAGVLLEAVLLLAYQSGHGVLYQDLGALLGVFMLGLTAGSSAVHALARRLSSRRAGFLLLSVLFAASVAVAARLRAESLPGLLETSLGLFVAGALTAAVFAHASLGARGSSGSAGRFYAADLAGGVFGSVAASLIAIPVLGLPGTALAAAVIAVAAALWV